MRNLIILLCLICLPVSLLAQGDSILDFFDNIFNISSLIEEENKDRLQRELKLFAQKADQLAQLKKETSSSMLAFCSTDRTNDSAIKSKTLAFNKLVNQSIDNLEQIRENVLFDSDYDITVDTIYQPTPIQDTLAIQLDPGCYLRTDTNFITEEAIPDGYTMANQMIMPVSQTIIDSVLVVNMYCPITRERRTNRHTWKTISFSKMVEGFQYSLQTKSRNINYLLHNCDRQLIVQERNRATKALEAMRDKALALRAGLE